MFGFPTRPDRPRARDEGTDRPDRAALNFVGGGVTATDDAANNEIEVKILDGAGAAEGTAQTVGAQTVALLSFTPTDGTVATARLRVTGRKSGGALSASFEAMARFRRAGAVVTQEGSMNFVAWERDEVVSLSFTIAGTTVTANAIGVAGSTWDFYATLNLVAA